MTYQVLARKWRPQNFSSLVGQEPIVTALRNALKEGRIAQAYLFSGIRGVGKTTAARVLAKALNCERGPAADPCNECRSCIDITRGSDLDVIEVDAATYSKVEQVRELTESLKYGPAHDRYKVVVLDEIHRLSRQAFDALLKIVEEPPPHLVFIFATTEIDAVPATILSRCQEFHFRRVPSQNLAAYLRNICEAEKITASDTALRLIARAGEGSVRDSVALLDQLATFGSGTIADEDAVRLLGGLDTALFQTLLAGDPRGRSPGRARCRAPGGGGGLGPAPRLRPVPRLLPRRAAPRHGRLARAGGPARRGGAGPRRHRESERLREPAPALEPAADQRAPGAPQRFRSAGRGDRLAAGSRAAEAHPDRGDPGWLWRRAGAAPHRRCGPASSFGSAPAVSVSGTAAACPQERSGAGGRTSRSRTSAAARRTSAGRGDARDGGAAQAAERSDPGVSGGGQQAAPAPGRLPRIRRGSALRGRASSRYSPGG